MRDVAELLRQLMAASVNQGVQVSSEARATQYMLLQLKRRVPGAQCQLCSKDCKVTDGVLCGGGTADVANDLPSHLLCGGCFAQRVRGQSREGLDDSRARGAHITCPIRVCAAPAYANCLIAISAPQAVHAEYEAAKERLREHKANELMQLEFETRVELQVKELQRLSAREAAVQQARNHICTTVLTLRCPRPTCNLAWIDFDACCALQCRDCNTHFCAYCLTTCGDARDAHAHVRQCQYGQNGGLWGAAQLPAAHNLVRTQRLRAYLSTMQSELRDAVLLVCQRELEDVGLNPQHFAG